MADLIENLNEKWKKLKSHYCQDFTDGISQGRQVMREAKEGDTIGELVLVRKAKETDYICIPRKDLLTEDNIAHLRAVMASANMNKDKQECIYCDGLMRDKLKALTLKEGK